MLLQLAVDSKQPLYGAGLKPALGKISKERAGLKPAPTLHRATILADKIILRQFHLARHFLIDRLEACPTTLHHAPILIGYGHKTFENYYIFQA
jgi:hypothetical protein